VHVSVLQWHKSIYCQYTVGNISVDSLVMCCSHKFKLMWNPWILSTLRIFLFLPCIVLFSGNIWQLCQFSYSLITSK
jgi:hypothetical protein